MEKIKIAYVVTSLFKCGPIQQTLNNIKYLDKAVFEPYIITLYPEDKKTSQLALFLQFAKHVYAPTSKINVMSGCTGNLKRALAEIKPDVVHSLGVFPDYAVSRIAKYKQVMTLRNFVWDDYPVRRGKLIGYILCKMQLYAQKRAVKSVVCSKSLSVMYKERLGLDIGYIQNGVDLDVYSDSALDKLTLRKKLGLPLNKVIFTYTAPLIDRKNHQFLIDSFLRFQGKANNSSVLLLLGDGPLRNNLMGITKGNENVIFGGSVLNVSEFLHASDVFVSSSMSEGLPNSVLEAVASGLPVILSDIPQHAELIEKDNHIGMLYRQDSIEDLVSVLQYFRDDLNRITTEAKKTDINKFSAKFTSEKYQEIYKTILNQ